MLGCILVGCNNGINVLINSQQECMRTCEMSNFVYGKVKLQLETSVSQKLQKVKSVSEESLCDFTSCFSVVSLLHMAS